MTITNRISNWVSNLKSNWRTNVLSDASAVPSVTVTTTQSGTFSFILWGASGTVYIDWGDGSALDSTTLAPAAPAKTHDYGDASSKTITLTGDLDSVTLFYAQAQNVTGMTGVSNLSIMNRFHLKNNSLFLYDIAGLKTNLLLDTIDTSGTSCYGDVSNFSGLTAFEYVAIFSSDVLGEFSSFSACTSLVSLNAAVTGIGCTTGPFATLDGAAIQLKNCNWAEAETDNFLIFAAAASWANCSIDISGNNAARTSASDVALGTLLAAGNTPITVNE